jgi:phosphomannomutase/phosphoglucomutase
VKHLGALSSQEKNPLILMAVLAVIVALAVVVQAPRYFDSLNVNSISKAVDAVAITQAEVLNTDIDKFQTVLTSQIKSFGIAQALQQVGTDALPAIAEQLKAANANMGVVDVRLIPVSNDYSSLNLRFSQLDRLTSIENKSAIYPEAFGESNNRVFDFLLPVNDESGKIVGFVLIITNEHVFSDNLGKVKPEIGETILQQRFPGGVAQVVFRTGNGERMEQVSSEMETKVPHWKVKVVPGETLLQENTWAAFWLYATQGVALILCVVVLVLINRRAAQLLKKSEAEHFTPIQIKGARKIDKEEFAAANAAQGDADTGLVDPLFQSGDVFDLDLDDDVLEVRAINPKTAQPVKTTAGTDNFVVPTTIFRDYDIRGNADNELSDALATRIGRAFGSACIEKGHSRVVLAGDGRLSTYRLKDAVREGLLMTGCSVVDIGTVPTPLMNFATQTLPETSCGIMVTASHNPAADNGFKMVIDGHTLASEEIQHIRERVQTGNFCESENEGEYSEQEIIDAYIDHIVSDVVLAGSYKVVVDCGSGVASVVAPRLLEELGCDVVPLYCDMDGTFPYHQPDPSVLSNLNDLIEAVKNEGADLGVAFDGDGDRLAVVTATGEVILPDCLMMLFAKDVVSRNPGTDIVFDVKSTRRLNALISSCGGRPVMCKSGHSHIRNKMVETGAMLGGELSGHIFFKERWFGFDDGVYSAVRLIEIMSIRDQSLDDIFSDFPSSCSTPEIRIAVPEDKKFSLVKRLIDGGDWGNGKVSTLDGVRVDFAKGWGLVRASNTAAELTLRFEADDADSLATVKNVFKQQLQQVDSGLPLPF